MLGHAGPVNIHCRPPAVCAAAVGRAVPGPGPYPPAVSDRRGLAPALIIGVGLGGFFDGIVLHQMLQWHHLVSGKVPAGDLAGLQFNTFVDGLFHQAMWLVTVVGVFLLYLRLVDTRRRGLRPLVGGILIGFGLFNVLDEIFFHVLLDLHHIRPGPDVVFWDLAFTAWGVAMIAVGWLMVRPSPGRTGHV